MILFSLAFAVPPDGIPVRFEVGMGQIDHLVLAADGGLVLGVSNGDRQAFVLDVDAWTSYTARPCDVTAITAASLSDDASTRTDVYIGCSDGMVHRYFYDDGALTADLGGDGAALSWDLTPSSNNGIDALFWDGDPVNPYLYAYESASPSMIHVLDVNASAVDVDVFANYPSVSLYSGYVDSTVTTDVNFGLMGYVAHGAGQVTTINMSTSLVTTSPPLGGLYSLNDIAVGTNLRLWGVDTSSDLLLGYNPSSGIFQDVYPTIDAPKAVVANVTAGDEWLLVAGQGVRVHQLNGGAILDAANPYFENLDADIFIQDAVASSEYAFGGGEGGRVAVITGKPWVSGATVDPSSGTSGSTLTVTFTVDKAVDWDIRLGGDRFGAGGTSLGTGTTNGEETVQATITISDAWAEGSNRLYIIAQDGGLVGHARVQVVVDDAPSVPQLTDANVGFAEEALILSFDGVPDADLVSYDIFILDQPFDEADLEAFPTLADGPSSPIVVPAAGGDPITQRLAPLVNGVTYYIGVRAHDATQVSPLSNVVTGSPRQSYTAADLAGEKGGGSCSTGGSGGSWGFLAGVFALLGRRRSAILGLLAISAPALADEVDDRGDITKQYGNFELRYGGFYTLADDSITTVYGKGGHNMLQVEVGPQITRFFEVDFEFGFYQELANTVTTGGDSSARRTMLTQFPLGMSVGARLQIFDEQIVVPYGKIGLDYVFYTELTDDGSGGKDKLRGSKMGNHYALGAGLLLDVFAPARASLLEAQTGINDTYITFEWRHQSIDGRTLPWGAPVTDGFQFTGSMFTIGLKLDY